MTISQQVLDATSDLSFSCAEEVDAYFEETVDASFVAWFSRELASRGAWGAGAGRAAIAIADPVEAEERFAQLWSEECVRTMFGGPMTLLQFVALQSIVLNETGGTLKPISERVGTGGHPGIAYAFDEIPGLKRSYNTLPGNRTCFELFNDDDYNREFAELPLADLHRETADERWKGTAYPAGVSTSTDARATGYLLEADFYKFRGRGFIQTTGRANYLPLIELVLEYAGDNEVLLDAREVWASAGDTPEGIATMSTNAQWDTLFMASRALLPAHAVALHSRGAGAYLASLEGSTSARAAESVRRVGLRVSGSSIYAERFLARVTELFDALAPAL